MIHIRALERCWGEGEIVRNDCGLPMGLRWRLPSGRVAYVFSDDPDNAIVRMLESDTLYKLFEHFTDTETLLQEIA